MASRCLAKINLHSLRSMAVLSPSPSRSILDRTLPRDGHDLPSVTTSSVSLDAREYFPSPNDVHGDDPVLRGCSSRPSGYVVASI